MFAPWKNYHLFLKLVLGKADDTLIVRRLSEIALLAVALEDIHLIVQKVARVNVWVLSNVAI